METNKETNRKLVCVKCNQEFDTNEECGEHALKEHHYEFKLKGTNLMLGIV